MTLSPLLLVAGVTGVGVLMLTAERLRPGRRWPDVTGWVARAVALNAVQLVIVLFVGGVWDGWMARHRPWSADALGPIAGGLLGYVAITFVYYWWHRARHASPLLWRWLHQVHHSPQRLEILTAFYKHPLEIAINGVLTSAVLYLAVGLGPSAATVAVLLTGLAELFYHWNVRTPAWIGWLVQRPENHLVHHQEGHHSHNFSDLPLWDRLFGTYRSADRWTGRCGLGPVAERRLGAMLRGADVTLPAGPPSPRRAVAVLLVILGVGQMGADVVGLPAVKAVALATAASPAPKVFSAVRGLETYSTQFFLEWTATDGQRHSLPLTADVNGRLRGPYNRRNVYGAVLAFGPVLPEALRTPVMRFGMCGRAPLFREIGVDPATVAGEIRVRLEPRPGTDLGALTPVMEVHCP